ncbi:MAG: type II secretion system minor pseudopilin GspK [Paraperlucidibaca sp.]
MRIKQRGVALLTMLLIAALATVLVTTIIERQARVQRELAGELQLDQVAQYNHGAALFAMAALREDGRQGMLVDHPGEDWAQPFPPFPVPGGLILPALSDAQARFNLNSLVTGGSVNQSAQFFYRRLLSQLLLPPELADSLVDWLDADSQPLSAAGAEDDYYLRLDVPYRAANRALSTFDELRLVRGYNRETMRALSAYVTVLPTAATKMNVNFISPGILEALVPGLAPASAVELLKSRPAAGWKSLAEFLDNPVFNGVSSDVRAVLTALLDVRSRYFELYTRVRFGDRERLQWTLIARRTSRLLDVIAVERNPSWVPDIKPPPENSGEPPEEQKDAP